MINVLVVDDHDIVRSGISRLISDEKGLKVHGECSSGEDAVAWCRKNDVDVILMDMTMPGIGGLEATRKIVRINPDVKIIVLTAYAEQPIPKRVMQAGAFGFLTKDSAPTDVLKAIRQVAAGQRFLSPEVAQAMAMGALGDTSDNPFDELSERELQITMMIINGEKATDMAEKLNLSPKTVNSYRYRIFDKIKVTGDVELTLAAIRHGILDKSRI
ncbi:UvrY/SirA/GacA family response regulator transcription factor [Paraferrimonas sp. SM1919]|uniref:UvrY/SirA/GacA family response regulator transcription factor n=1 Tax=Paraferrimonas sp. SM1919 TaxID=2662263 RepID=UPI0013CFBC6E|nr:UvrY/SirA/GacA family response regulator transcription factor [Paraferrimonas sp. SM1919]